MDFVKKWDKKSRTRRGFERPGDENRHHGKARRGLLTRISRRKQSVVSAFIKEVQYLYPRQALRKTIKSRYN